MKSTSSRNVHLIPLFCPVVFFIIQSMTRLNRTADIMHPCMTPDFTLNAIFDCPMVHVVLVKKLVEVHNMWWNLLNVLSILQRLSLCMNSICM